MQSRGGRHRWRGRAAGVTLPELLISVGILAAIMGVIGALYLAGIRAWYAETAAATADNQARWALKWLVPVIREARAVVPEESDHHRLTFVQTYPTLSGPVYVSNGDTITLYLGDATGEASVSPRLLWFTRNGLRVQSLANDLVKADGEQGFEVEYIKQDGTVLTDVTAATVRGLVAVRLTITAYGRSGGTSRFVSMSNTVPLRNLN